MYIKIDTLCMCLRTKAGIQPGGIAREIVNNAKKLVISRLRECRSDAARLAVLVGQH
jgi:hypothetical protein